MRYVAAYLLAALGGKEHPAGDIEKILSSVGIEVDSVRLSQVVAQFKGKSTDDLMNEGRKKLSAIPVGGGVVATAAAHPVSASEEKKAEKKEEKKEESESEDDDMGFGLFE